MEGLLINRCSIPSQESSVLISGYIDLGLLRIYSSPKDFERSYEPFWLKSSLVKRRSYEITDGQRNFNQTLICSQPVPADGLAPYGARPSAGTVMTKFRFDICTQLVLQGSDLSLITLHHSGMVSLKNQWVNEPICGKRRRLVWTGSQETLDFPKRISWQIHVASIVCFINPSGGETRIF